MKVCSFLFNFIYLSIYLVLGHVSAQSSEVFLYNTEDGLPQNNLSQLMFDKDDRLWIGTLGGLCLFDGQKIYQITHPDLAPRIRYIHKDAEQEIYIVDENNHIFKKNMGDNRLQKLNQKSEFYENWFFNSDQYKRKKIEDQNDHLNSFHYNILGYRNVKKFNKDGTYYYIEYHQVYDELETYFLLDTFLIGLDRDNKWIQHTNAQVFKTITSDLPTDFNKKGFVFNTDDGTFGLYDKTIYKLQLLNDHLMSIPIVHNVDLDARANLIKSGQYNAKTGYFYFASSTYGLYEVIPSSFQIKTNKSQLKDPRLIIYGNSCYSQSEIDSNVIFVNNYAILKDSTDVLVPNINYPFNRAVNIVDSKGWLWYSDDQDIIIQKGTKKTNISLAPLSYPILSIAEISTNKYLLLHPHFIIEMDTTKEIRRFKLGSFQDSNYEYAQYLHYDKITKKLYVLSNKNIHTVNLENGHIVPNKLLKESDYRIMTPLADSLSFVGTYGQGYYIKIKEKYISMPMDKKGYLKFAHTALCDSNGHVWISTNNGLFRTRLQDIMDYISCKSKDIFYYYYDKSSGWLTNEFNGGCQSPGIKLRDGRFSFSSMDGLVQFDPLKVSATFPDNPIQIIHLYLNGRNQDSIPANLVIPQDIKDIKLEVSIAFYGEADNLILQYKIPGYVDEWADLTHQRYITLQNAKHGRFNIEIRKRRGFGTQDFDYFSYPVNVLPYYYQTWWFLAFMGLGLTIIVVGAAKWYSNNLVTQKAKLEKLIQERNLSLIDTNKALEDKIKQNEMFHSILVHEIKAPIFFMGTISDEMIKGWEHLTKEDIKNNINIVSQAANSTHAFVVNFLTWVKSHNDRQSLHTEAVYIRVLMNEVVALHSHNDKIKRGRLTIVIDCADDINIQANRKLLKIVLGNLLSNSIKFSNEGTITLYAYRTDNSLVMGCVDQGKGMNTNTVALLMSSQYKGNAIRKDSFRMGYVFILDIIKILKAEIKIQSELGVGTDVTLEIKTNELHEII